MLYCTEIQIHGQGRIRVGLLGRGHRRFLCSQEAALDRYRRASPVMLLSNGTNWLSCLICYMYSLLAPSGHILHPVDKPETLGMPIVSCLARKSSRSSCACNPIESVTDGQVIARLRREPLRCNSATVIWL